MKSVGDPKGAFLSNAAGAALTPIQGLSQRGRLHLVPSGENLAELAVRGRGTGSATRPGVETIRTIVDRAMLLDAPMLLLGAHGRSGFSSGFQRFVLGSATERALRMGDDAGMDCSARRVSTGVGPRQ